MSPESSGSSSVSSEGEIWLIGRPEFENLGCSGFSSGLSTSDKTGLTSSCLSSSSSFWSPTGRRARFPVGTILTPGRRRPFKTDPRGPVDSSSVSSSSA